MSSRKPSAGDFVSARCTRCRTITNHTIVAMYEEKVVRVQCNTCSSVHNYYPEKEKKAPSPRTSAAKASSPRAAAPRTSRKDPSAGEREEWQALRPSLDPERALPYSMSMKLRVNDLVRHPVFGLGVVRALAGPQKAEVLFESGKKLLRCG